MSCLPSQIVLSAASKGDEINFFNQISSIVLRCWNTGYSVRTSDDGELVCCFRAICLLMQKSKSVLANLRKCEILGPASTMRFRTEELNTIPLENITILTVTFQDPPDARDIKEDEGFGSFHNLASTAPNLRILRCIFLTVESMIRCYSLDLQIEGLNLLERIEYNFKEVYCREGPIEGLVDRHQEYHLRIGFFIRATIFLQLPQLGNIRIVIPWDRPPVGNCEKLKNLIKSFTECSFLPKPKEERQVCLFKDGYGSSVNHIHRPSIYDVSDSINIEKGQCELDIELITKEEWLYNFNLQTWWFNK